LAHAGGPTLLSSFAEGVFVIQADIRKVYIFDNEVMDLEHPSRTALRADLAGRIITMKDAAEPNPGLAEMVQEFMRHTDRDDCPALPCNMPAHPDIGDHRKMAINPGVAYSEDHSDLGEDKVSNDLQKLRSPVHS
jgi:hypothetical protein